MIVIMLMGAIVFARLIAEVHAICANLRYSINNTPQVLNKQHTSGTQ